MEFNHQQRQVLCSLAQAEIKRQKQLKQLEAIDADILEYLKKFLVSSTVQIVIQLGTCQKHVQAQRQRKRREAISQRDKDQAWKALEARDRTLKHLQSMDT